MTRWSFEIRINRAPSDDEIDAMFEGGLDDCSIAGGLLYCNREAVSLLGAVASVSADIRKVTGLRPVAVEADDPVTLGDAAQRLRGLRSAESLRLLAEGKRGPGGFPARWSTPATFGCSRGRRSRPGFGPGWATTSRRSTRT